MIPFNAHSLPRNPEDKGLEDPQMMIWVQRKVTPSLGTTKVTDLKP